MTVPWLAAIGVEYAVFGRFFAADLNTGARPRRDRAPRDQDTGLPVFTLVVVALTLAGFAGASAAGVNPAWAAFAGAAVLAARALARRRVAPVSLVRAADLPFLLFLLGLGIVVMAVTDNGLGRALAPLLPGGTSLPALLAVAALAAALANVWPRTGSGAAVNGWRFRIDPNEPWWQPRRIRICWSWRGTATGPGSARRAWARSPGSSWITRPAPFCWSGQSLRPMSPPFPRRHIILPLRAAEPAKPGHGVRLLVASPSPSVAKKGWLTWRK